MDKNWHAISVLKYGDTAKLSVAGTTARVALPSGVQAQTIVRVACNTDCYIKLGDSSVDATTNDLLFLAGVEYITIAPNQTHLAALSLGVSGVLTITEVY